MSLMLRKQCQEHLNNCGLGDYHTRIDGNKYLSIVGPCGKPLFNVTGIEFVRNTPTIKEIEFAGDLLEDFCAEHKKSIAIVLKAKTALFNAKIPSVPSKYSFKDDYTRVHIELPNTQIKFTLGSDSISYKTDGYAYIPLNIKEIAAEISPTNVKKLKKYAKELKAYDAIETAYQNAISALQTCNI